MQVVILTRGIAGGIMVLVIQRTLNGSDIEVLHLLETLDRQEVTEGLVSY